MCFALLDNVDPQVVWIFVAALHVWSMGRRHDPIGALRGFAIQLMAVALVWVTTTCAIDRVFYGTWTFVPFNFLHFNVLVVSR